VICNLQTLKLPLLNAQMPDGGVLSYFLKKVFQWILTFNAFVKWVCKLKPCAQFRLHYASFPTSKKVARKSQIPIPSSQNFDYMVTKFEPNSNLFLRAIAAHGNTSLFLFLFNVALINFIYAKRPINLRTEGQRHHPRSKFSPWHIE